MSILDENTARNMNANAGLGVSSEMKRSWTTISKWALFFAVIGFVYIGLSLLMLGSMGAMLEMMARMGGDNPIFAAIGPMMSYMTIISVVMMAFLFFVNFFHLRFSTQIKQAVNFNDQSAFEKSWMNLRNHFRLYGILICVIMVFYVIMIIVVGSAVAGAALEAQ